MTYLGPYRPAGAEAGPGARRAAPRGQAGARSVARARLPRTHLSRSRWRQACCRAVHPDDRDAPDLPVRL